MVFVAYGMRAPALSLPLSSTAAFFVFYSLLATLAPGGFFAALHSLASTQRCRPLLRCYSIWRHFNARAGARRCALARGSAVALLTAARSSPAAA